jgi:hypothetical protein
VQPTQLSLMPQQVPAPPAALVAGLPEAQVRTAVMLLARLIAQCADPSTATRAGRVVGDE